MLRLGDLRQLFFGQNLLALQLGNPLFIGRNGRVVACVNDLVEKLLDALDVRLEPLGGFHGLLKAHVPRIFEHGLDEPEKVH